jgi:queuine/archaeosine tRNA-ribosyltransferase
LERRHPAESPCRSNSLDAADPGGRRKFDRVDHETPAFLPVHVVSEEVKGLATVGIEIVLANGRCLRVGPGFDPDTLVKVVDLLEAGGASC